MSDTCLACPKRPIWAHPIVTTESFTGMGASLGEGRPTDSPHLRVSVIRCGCHAIHITYMIWIVRNITVPQGKTVFFFFFFFSYCTHVTYRNF
jgi:hypothetical protein